MCDSLNAKICLTGHKSRKIVFSETSLQLPIQQVWKWILRRLRTISNLYKEAFLWKAVDWKATKSS